MYEVSRRGYTRSRIYLYSHSVLTLASIIFISCFLLDDFSLYEVYNYSSTTLPLALKLAASWSGKGGSIVWWLFFFNLAVLAHRFRIVSKSIYEVESYKRQFIAYDLAALTLLIALFALEAFTAIPTPTVNGLGLNPLLRSFWVYFHPPTALLSYALGLVVGISALVGVKDKF